MKNLLIIIICLVNIKINAQEIIKNNLYEVVYSEEYQQPLSIKYTLPCNLEQFKKESKRIPFHLPNNISTSDNYDYEGTVYDKAHLAPVNAFKCVEDNLSLYSYLNCCLMHLTLNRGIWSSLEEYEYLLAKDNANCEVKISITLIFNDINNKVDGGATIPSHFLKVIDVVNQLENSERYVYIFPNDESVKGKNINDFKVRGLCKAYKTSTEEK